MIIEVLFIVFFVLWGISLFVAEMGRYTGALAWVCVGLLALRVFGTHGVL